MEQLIAYINHIAPVSKAAREELIPLFRPDQLTAGEFFIQEGQYAQEIAFLQKGCVRAYFVNRKGKEYNKNFFVGPSIIGAYTSLLKKQPNKIAQRALTDCLIMRAPYHQIEQL